MKFVNTGEDFTEHYQEPGEDHRSELTELLVCRHCSSKDGYYKKATSKSIVYFCADGAQSHFYTNEVRYGKRKYCVVCGKAN